MSTIVNFPTMATAMEPRFGARSDNRRVGPDVSTVKTMAKYGAGIGLTALIIGVLDFVLPMITDFCGKNGFEIARIQDGSTNNGYSIIFGDWIASGVKLLATYLGVNKAVNKLEAWIRPPGIILPEMSEGEKSRIREDVSASVNASSKH